MSLTFRPSFPRKLFFVSSERDIHRTTSGTSLTSLRHTGFVKDTLTAVYMSRITFRVNVKEVLLKVFPQIQRKQWCYKIKYIHLLRIEVISDAILLGYPYAPINISPAGGGGRGMGWGFDCLCWPWSRAFDWSCSPRGGDIGIFLPPTWRYLTADLDEKDWDRTFVSLFHASRMRRTVWKDLEIVEANKNKRKLGGFHCFVFKFRLF